VLLHESDEGVLTAACDALRCLAAADAECAWAASDADALAAVVSVVLNDGLESAPRAVPSAIAALHCIAEGCGDCGRLIEAGGIRAIVAAMAALGADRKVLIAGARALSALSEVGGKDVQTRAQIAGGLQARSSALLIPSHPC
jgi:hypothetical protein